MKDGLSGEIMEISGLGQSADEVIRKGESTWTGSASSILAFTAFGLFGLYLLSRKYGWGVASWFEQVPHALASPLQSLGILKKCRRSDRKKGRRASSQRWCLWDSKGKRILGRHSSRRKALRQEAAIKIRGRA
jgi:hypothetical protein